MTGQSAGGDWADGPGLIVAAVLLAGLAAWFWVRPGERMARRRLTATTAAPEKPHLGRPLLLLVVVAAPAVGLLSGAGAVVLALAGLGATVGLLAWRKRREAKALATRRAAVRACGVLDSLLAQGRAPVQGLIQASQDCPLLAPAAACAQMGGDVAAVLRRSSAAPGAEGLAEVARAWSLTERTGAPLHGVLARSQANLRSQAELSDVIAQELASSRATSQLLAILPLLGLGLTAMVGGDPLGFLTGTVVGRVCFLAGVALICLGALWSDALALRASRLTPKRAGRRAARDGDADSGAAEAAPALGPASRPNRGRRT
ncbi:MAG: hypothetical protein LBK42_13455 [Propionibacteriaceae bacterium]|jgi:tight adherence protein B|nr:hypothetical protein [Propionibacteriaceae bacterium]